MDPGIGGINEGGRRRREEKGKGGVGGARRRKKGKGEAGERTELGGRQSHY